MIRKYAVADLPSALYQKLYRLNEGELSLMKHELSTARGATNDDSFVTVSTANDGTVNGWCIVTGDSNILQVYVRHAKRRRGIGSRLVAHATRFTKKEPKVVFRKAIRFFTKNKLTKSV
jgi:GNAT superfamily N-acetyltransferase